MNKQGQLSLVNELLWFLIAVIVITMVLFPLVELIKGGYLAFNSFLVFITVMYFRFALNGKSVFYLQKNPVIYAFTLLNLVFLGTFFVQFQEYLYQIDNYVLTFFLADGMELDSEKVTSLFRYFKTEFLFFSVTSVLMTFAFQFRLIKQLWKTLAKN